MTRLSKKHPALGQWPTLLRPSVATLKAQPADLSPPFAAIVRSRSRCREFKSIRAGHITKSSVFFGITFPPPTHKCHAQDAREQATIVPARHHLCACFQDGATRTGLLRPKGARKKRMRTFVIAGTSIEFRLSNPDRIWINGPTRCSLNSCRQRQESLCNGVRNADRALDAPTSICALLACHRAVVRRVATRAAARL